MGLIRGKGLSLWIHLADAVDGPIAVTSLSLCGSFFSNEMFNYREGYRREDDQIPDRFFTEPLTIGDEKGAILDREEFKLMMDEYYVERGWDPATTRPSDDKIKQLGLSFFS
jgi:aldehyde:ferredoxin oxidoreductase